MDQGLFPGHWTTEPAVQFSTPTGPASSTAKALLDTYNSYVAGSHALGSTPPRHRSLQHCWMNEQQMHFLRCFIAKELPMATRAPDTPGRERVVCSLQPAQKKGYF